jgi:3-dehydroquinate synthase
LLPTPVSLFLVDQNTKACLERMTPAMDSNRILVVPAGESSKSLATCELVWAKMTELNLKRNDCLVCLGGGVITDLGAFCASVFKRGINYIHVPTSLLAMVDAAIGGKNGVNFRQLKNQIGSFTHAEKTAICPEFLSSLPLEDLRSGYAEIIKHGLIASGDLWLDVQKLQSLEVAPDLSTIKNAGIIKDEIVKGDFRENGERKLLNFGHTAAHAIESVCFASKQHVSHGDAVAAGMIIEAYISNAKGLLSDQEFEQIGTYLTLHFPPIHLEESQLPDVLSYAKQDKKSTSDNINCTLLAAIGKGKIDQQISDSDFYDACIYYQNKSYR